MNLVRRNVCHSLFLCFIKLILGKVKNLSALNLDGNPLEYPPTEVIRQGIKAIQQYLRENLALNDKLSSSSSSSSSLSADYESVKLKFVRHHPSTGLRNSRYFDRYNKKVKEARLNIYSYHLRFCL